MADSLDDKANGKEPRVNAETIDNQDNLKLRQNIAREIDPDCYKDIDGKDPTTHSP